MTGVQTCALPIYKAACAVGWKRVFRSYSQKWGGGVASIIKKKDSTVYGAAAYLDKDQIKLLDIYEGVKEGYYEKKKIEILIEHEGELIPAKAIAYICLSDEHNKPSKAYLQAIVKTVGEFWKNESGKKIKTSDFDTSG